MRRVIWRAEARLDYREATFYVADRDVSAARSLVVRIEAAVIRLSQRPTGRPGRNPGVFEKPVSGTSYNLVYAATDDELYILRLIHQRRHWPVGGWPEN